MTASRVPAVPWTPAVPRIAGWTAVGVGVLVLVSWVFGAPLLREAAPGLVPRAHTAFVLLLAGGSLVGLGGRPQRVRTLGRVLAGLGALYAGVGLLASLGVIAVPAQYVAMPPNTGAAGLAWSLAILATSTRRPRAIVLAQMAALGLVVLATITLIGYLYGAPDLFGVVPATRMTAPAATIFLILACGLLATSPTSGPIARILRDDLSGRLARRLLVTAVTIPPALGVLGFQGGNRGWFPVHTGEAIVTTATMALLCLVIYDAAGSLGTAERARRQADEERRRNAARFETLIESAADAILVIDEAGIIQSTNGRDEDLFGYARAELVGQPIETLIPPDVRGRHAQHRAGFMANPLARSMGAALDLRALRRDGTEFPAEISLSPLKFDDSLQVMAIVRDVTDRRRLEDQLRQAQKMEAIGRLAGGVAHDFNNQLNVILGYAQFLVDALPPADPRREDVLAIRSAADRSAALTGQLLAFSRRQMLRVQVVDPAAVVAGFESMLRRLLGEQITLRIHLSPDRGHVRVDPGQLEQVIMNLAINARDAMPAGGDLTIATSAVDLGLPSAAGQLASGTGRHVLLTVHDNGLGMDAETRSRLFEPFFTTKDLGSGTGLGLATVYGIVTQAGGQIHVDSEPGRGTTFRVYLPLVEEPADAPPARAAAVSSTRGDETILAVEDDDGVRALVVQIVKRLGYTVHAAAGPLEAIRLAGEMPLLDGLVTDVVMPLMNGGDVARRVQQLHPGVRVLYISGYAEDSVVRDGVVDPGVNLLQKPFTSEALAIQLRAVLDG